MTTLAKACLRSKRGDGSGSKQGKPGKPASNGTGASKSAITPDELFCHFNPSSLRLTYSNQFGEGKPFAHARETVAKDTPASRATSRMVTESNRLTCTRGRVDNSGGNFGGRRPD